MPPKLPKRTIEAIREYLARPFIEMTWKQFNATYTLRPNHLVPSSCWEGCMFETFGEEREYVLQQDPATIWTIIAHGDEEYLLSGFHFVNRMGYLISNEPAPDGTNIEVDLTPDRDQEGGGQ